MKPVTPTNSKWRPGSGGRKPKWAKGLSNAQIKKLLDGQATPNPAVTAPAPSASPSAAPPPSIHEEEIGTAPLPNPLGEAPSPGEAPGAPVEAPPDSEGPTVKPDSVEYISAPTAPVSGSEPWNNPQIVSGLAPFIGGMGKWLMAFACVKAGKVPPQTKDLDAWGFDEKAARSALIVYPKLAETDPRYLIVSEFVGGCLMIVKGQPDLPRSAPSPAQSPSPAPQGEAPDAGGPAKVPDAVEW